MTSANRKPPTSYRFGPTVSNLPGPIAPPENQASRPSASPADRPRCNPEPARAHMMTATAATASRTKLTTNGTDDASGMPMAATSALGRVTVRSTPLPSRQMSTDARQKSSQSTENP